MSCPSKAKRSPPDAIQHANAIQVWQPPLNLQPFKTYPNHQKRQQKHKMRLLKTWLHVMYTSWSICFHLPFFRGFWEKFRNRITCFVLFPHDSSWSFPTRRLVELTFKPRYVSSLINVKPTCSLGSSHDSPYSLSWAEVKGHRVTIDVNRQFETHEYEVYKP